MVDLSATVSEGELRGDQRRRGRGNAPTSSTPYVPRTPLTGPGLPQMESSYGVLAALPDTSVIKFGAGFPVSGAGGLQHITWQESDASRELECLRTVVRRERLLEDVEITLRQKEQAAAVNNADVVLHGEHVVGKDSNPLIGTEGLECPPDAVIEELLKSLRELTLQVVDAIGRWQMEREATRHGAEAINLAFMYNEENYLLKVISDCDFLDKFKAAKCILQVVSLRGNPFLVKQPLHERPRIIERAMKAAEIADAKALGIDPLRIRDGERILLAEAKRLAVLLEPAAHDREPAVPPQMPRSPEKIAEAAASPSRRQKSKTHHAQIDLKPPDRSMDHVQIKLTTRLEKLQLEFAQVNQQKAECEAQVKAQERLCTKLQEGLDALHAAVKLARRRRDPAVHNLEINLQYHTDEFGAQTKELKLVKAKHFFEEEEVKRLQRLEKKVQGSLGEHRAMLERKKLEREGRKQLKETVAATKIQSHIRSKLTRAQLKPIIQQRRQEVEAIQRKLQLKATQTELELKGAIIIQKRARGMLARKSVEQIATPESEPEARRKPDEPVKRIEPARSLHAQLSALAPIPIPQAKVAECSGDVGIKTSTAAEAKKKKQLQDFHLQLADSMSIYSYMHASAIAQNAPTDHGPAAQSKQRMRVEAAEIALENARSPTQVRRTLSLGSGPSSRDGGPLRPSLEEDLHSFGLTEGSFKEIRLLASREVKGIRAAETMAEANFIPWSDATVRLEDESATMEQEQGPCTDLSAAEGDSRTGLESQVEEPERTKLQAFPKFQAETTDTVDQSGTSETSGVPGAIAQATAPVRAEADAKAEPHLEPEVSQTNANAQLEAEHEHEPEPEMDSKPSVEAEAKVLAKAETADKLPLAVSSTREVLGTSSWEWVTSDPGARAQLPARSDDFMALDAEPAANDQTQSRLAEKATAQAKVQLQAVEKTRIQSEVKFDPELEAARQALSRVKARPNVDQQPQFTSEAEARAVTAEWALLQAQAQAQTKEVKLTAYLTVQSIIFAAVVTVHRLLQTRTAGDETDILVSATGVVSSSGSEQRQEAGGKHAEMLTSLQQQQQALKQQMDSMLIHLNSMLGKPTSAIEAGMEDDNDAELRHQVQEVRLKGVAGDAVETTSEVLESVLASQQLLFQTMTTMAQTVGAVGANMQNLSSEVQVAQEAYSSLAPAPHQSEISRAPTIRSDLIREVKESKSTEVLFLNHKFSEGPADDTVADVDDGAVLLQPPVDLVCKPLRSRLLSREDSVTLSSIGDISGSHSGLAEEYPGPPTYREMPEISEYDLQQWEVEQGPAWLPAGTDDALKFSDKPDTVTVVSLFDVDRLWLETEVVERGATDSARESVRRQAQVQSLLAADGKRAMAFLDLQKLATDVKAMRIEDARSRALEAQQTVPSTILSSPTRSLRSRPTLPRSSDGLATRRMGITVGRYQTALMKPISALERRQLALVYLRHQGLRARTFQWLSGCARQQQWQRTQSTQLQTLPDVRALNLPERESPEQASAEFEISRSPTTTDRRVTAPNLR